MRDLLLKGIENFNRGSFFEAHDLWEELWVETRGEERLFYQGLIQTAVGLYHHVNENYRGASSQFGKALLKLQRFCPSCQGVNTQQLVQDVEGCLRSVTRMNNGEEVTLALRIPVIQILSHDSESK
jgi:uncharacterized protein